MFDLKSFVRELADSLQAIYEQDGSGFSIEVPLKGERFQTVSVFFDSDDVLELLSVVHELDKSAQGTIDRYGKKAKHCKVTLEPEPEGGVYKACVRGIIPVAKATREKVEPVLVEVAKLGDGIENELTGGDVD